MSIHSETVATFNITYTQFLNESGQTTQPLPPFTTQSEQLIHAYETMVLTRVFDSKAIALQRTGRLGTYPSSLGQEAITVGIGQMMAADDVFFPYYREYGTQLQRGVALEDILAYWGGDERGSDFAHCKEDFPHCIPIASQTLHATGAALAFKLRQQQRAAVTIVGDGGTSEGDFYEAINLAGAWHLPIVFVINNNQWAISVPRDAQTATQTLAQKAIAAGIPGKQIDGNDIIAVMHSMQQALQDIRDGKGPSVIEMITYRLCDHTTADDASRYRDAKEIEQAWQKEPIKRLKQFLEDNNLWDSDREKALQTRCKQDVEAAVSHYESRTPQAPESMFDHLFAQLPRALEEQREQLIERTHNTKE